MRYVLSALALLLVVLASAYSCQKETVSTEAETQGGSLVGKWRLVEHLADPGDGSGTWQKTPAEFVETIEFRADGSFVAESANGLSTGDAFDRYTVLDGNRLEMRFRPGTNQAASHTWTYENPTPTTLTLRYGCIEACGGKYVAVK